MSKEQIESNIGSSESMPTMPKKSRYSGQLIDVSSRRSIEIIPRMETDATIDPIATHVEVDYFYHQGQFWRAVFPLDEVDQVYGQVFNFSKAKTKPSPQGPEIVFDKQGVPKRTIPILNHIQSRFTLKSPHTIDLYPMGIESTEEPVFRLNDFVYTAEAVGPLGVRFNLRDALAGHLISAHRFLSTQEMVFERIVSDNDYVTESPALPLNDFQKRAVLTESILRSHRAGMAEQYILFRVFGTNNCTSIPFEILDRVLDYTFLQRLGSKLYRLPLSPRFYLKVRGLDQDSSVRKLLRHEFADFIQHPKTQQRKWEREAGVSQNK